MALWESPKTSNQRNRPPPKTMLIAHIDAKLCTSANNRTQRLIVTIGIKDRAFIHLDRDAIDD